MSTKLEQALAQLRTKQLPGSQFRAGDIPSLPIESQVAADQADAKLDKAYEVMGTSDFMEHVVLIPGNDAIPAARRSTGEAEALQEALDTARAILPADEAAILGPALDRAQRISTAGGDKANGLDVLATLAKLYQSLPDEVLHRRMWLEARDLLSDRLGLSQGSATDLVQTLDSMARVHAKRRARAGSATNEALFRQAALLAGDVLSGLSGPHLDTATLTDLDAYFEVVFEVDLFLGRPYEESVEDGRFGLDLEIETLGTYAELSNGASEEDAKRLVDLAQAIRAVLEAAYEQLNPPTS